MSSGPAVPVAGPTSPGALGVAPPVLGVAFTGWGRALPGPPVTNHDLPAHLETSDEWIKTRTGIGARHHVGAGDSTASMGAAAAQEALSRAGRSVSDVDLLVVATTTPDRACPATASDLAAIIGLRAPACDVGAACNGFVAALHLALPAVASGSSRVALVVGSERMTSLVDPSDRGTAVLFGDGAGALVLETPVDGLPNQVTVAPRRRPGLVAGYLDGDASLIAHLSVPPDERWLAMDGPEVFRAATRALTESARSVMSRAGITAPEVDLYVPHQANQRIVDAVTARLGIAPERVVITLDRHGNTSAASVPIALAEAADDGRLRPGHLVLVSAVGAGMTWGSLLLRWGGQ